VESESLVTVPVTFPADKVKVKVFAEIAPVTLVQSASEAFETTGVASALVLM
jgi:hypothetical protein